MKNNKLSITKLGKLNPQWKGDDVGYYSLHEWIRNRLVQPESCELCKIKNPKLDLANKSGKYLRDLDDWEFLCRKCHMTKDGRLHKWVKRLKNRKKELIPVICKYCKNTFYMKPFLKRIFCSYSCSSKTKDRSHLIGNTFRKDSVKT